MFGKDTKDFDRLSRGQKDRLAVDILGSGMRFAQPSHVGNSTK
jgi:hypothetical protein